MRFTVRVDRTIHNKLFKKLYKPIITEQIDSRDNQLGFTVFNTYQEAYRFARQEHLETVFASVWGLKYTNSRSFLIANRGDYKFDGYIVTKVKEPYPKAIEINL